MGSGSGFGKAILFGEHFVIYDVPGIVAGLRQTVDATVTRIRGAEAQIKDLRTGARGYTEKKRAQQRESLGRVFNHLGLGSPGIEIVIEGNLPAFSGIGSSGASSVAIVRAISDEFGLSLTDEQVNAAAHEAERAYHGERTAGLDNLASTYGGLIYFEQVRPLRFEPFRIAQPIDIVMADTKEMIAGVAQRQAERPDQYETVFAEAREVIRTAKSALLDFDLEQVGNLMNENHRLLQAIEVTCPELDHLAGIARRHGALGAKQTGGGGGGCILALTPVKDLQQAVAEALEAEGYAVLKTRIPNRGDDRW